MNWIVMIGIAIFCDAIRVFIDNYITDVYYKKRGAVAQKLFYGISYVITMTIFLACSGLDFGHLNVLTVAMLIGAGIVSALAGIPYYRAIEIEDTTEVSIFFQLMPIAYLIAGCFFLGEHISPLQLAAFIIILAAPVLIIFSARKRSRKIKFRAVFYILFYVLLSVSANMILLTSESESLGIYQKIGFMLLGKGIGNIGIVLFNPRIHRRFQNVMKASGLKIYRPLITDFSVGLVCEFLYRAALAAAPAVALASAVGDASEPIIIFFLGIVLTILWPSFGREKLDKKTVFVHLIATLMVVGGIVMLQF